MKAKYFRTVLVLSLILASLVPLAFATTLLHRNLKEMVTLAERVFVGRCVAVEEGALEFPTGKIYYTQYTFAVSEALKGHVGEQVTFRQFGLIKPRKVADNLALYQQVPSMPVYNENEQYMLFLIRDSKYGLTSPVGLHQGAFRIQRDQLQREVAVNGIFNRGLFRDMSFKDLSAVQFTDSEKKLFSQSRGPVALREFVSLVKKYASGFNRD